MLSVIKNLLMLFLLCCQLAHGKDIYILVLGESLAANCNQHIFKAEPNVLQIGLDSNLKPAQDPLEWSDCNRGSVWIPLGKEIIHERLANRVVFMPIGVSGSRIQDWQPGGQAFDKLNRAVKTARSKKISFDYAFWFQGLSDTDRENKGYFHALDRTIKYVDRSLQIDKWLIARHSKCGGKSDLQIGQAQQKLGTKFLYARYHGPNVDLLPRHYWNGECLLNKNGQTELARQWIEAIKKADANDEKLKKETLVYYFR